MTFAIAALEQGLQELQPHVVVKLQEGRQKRLKLCEKTFKDRKKDLEQRSIETCIVSSSALETFKEKSEKKLKETELEWKKSISTMNSLLIQ